jgi:hypothetical protein
MARGVAVLMNTEVSDNERRGILKEVNLKLIIPQNN